MAPHYRRLLIYTLFLACLIAGTTPRGASAQASLRLTNSETTVREISFRFVDRQTFETSRLREQIATTAPGFLYPVRRRLAFVPGLAPNASPFDPVMLQKDVVRLRRFYQQNGFLDPEIDYPASQLDTSANSIHVIFTVREGPFLTIENTEFVGAQGTSPITASLEKNVQADWQSFLDTQVEVEGRYTDFKRTQLEGQVQSWFRNRGYAFAEVQSVANVDSTEHTVDLQFQVDAGPRAVVSEIQIEGNDSVAERIIRRELPFAVGDLFSAEEVTRGQQKLFDLSLFRVALADVPDQPRDSTVTVRFRVRESNMRSVSGQVGYGTRPGITLDGSWRHRNFFGNARTFIVGLTADTGVPKNPPQLIPGFLTRSSAQELSREFRGSLTLRQPYLFSNSLSGSVAPFFVERLNPALTPNPNRPLQLNERQFGVNTTLVYDFLAYRSLSLQHSFARTRQYLTSDTRTDPPVGSPQILEDDLYNKSIFTLNGTVGDANNFVSPTRGLLVRPSVQLGGMIFESGIEFVQGSVDLSGYLPLSEQVNFAGRVFVGTLFPMDESHTSLTLSPDPSDEAVQQNRLYLNRFSDYLFYAGGGSDVRGWASRLAGGKVLRESPLLQSEYVYRPIGARTKVGVNLEVRLPLPGLGSSWRTAAFIDGAYVTPGDLHLTPPTSAAGIIAGADGTPVRTDASRILVGSGGGLRYETSFGFLRIDLAYKLTPDALDLRSALDVGRAVTADDPTPVREVRTRWLRRFRLHFGIGRSF